MPLLTTLMDQIPQNISRLNEDPFGLNQRMPPLLRAIREQVPGLMDFNIQPAVPQQQGGVPMSSSPVQSPAELDPIIREASATYGVPENVIRAIIKAESDFNPNSYSTAGAKGYMQLMPETAKEMGVTNVMDARQNIMGGTGYYAKMLKMFNGDHRMALAAYNAGPGNVKKYGGIPPFKETQNYVPKVMGFAGLK